MQSNLVKKLFHRKLSNDVEQCLAFDRFQDEEVHLEEDESTRHPEQGQLKAVTAETDPEAPAELPTAPPKGSSVMPRTVRELLSDNRAAEPRYVRLHNANYTPRELLSEILSMANRIVRRVSEGQLSSNDRRWWPVREVASKWDSIRAYPEMLQDVDAELLKILVLDAYADMERLERA